MCVAILSTGHFTEEKTTIFIWSDRCLPVRKISNESVLMSWLPTPRQTQSHYFVDTLFENVFLTKVNIPGVTTALLSFLVWVQVTIFRSENQNSAP